MKKVILPSMLVAALFVTSVKAQKIHFGPKIGGNLSWITKARYDDEKGINNARFFLHGGEYSEYMFNDTWGLDVETLYTGIGNRKDNENQLKLGYFNVPILAEFHVPSMEGLSFHMGPQVGFLMSAKESIQDEVIPTKNQDVRELFKEIDFAIVGGAEYAFDFGLIVGARYNFGVIDIYKDEYKPESDDNKYTNQFLQVYVGYNLAKVLAK